MNIKVIMVMSTAIVVVLTMAGCIVAHAPLQIANPASQLDDPYLQERMDETFIADTSALVKIQTYRSDAPDREEQVVANLKRIQAYLNQRAETFNAGQASLRLEPFEWQEEIDGVNRWVFGFRVGNGYANSLC